MEGILDIGLSLSLWLQLNYPGLRGVMTWISILGQFEVYLALLLFIYWCIDKRAGVHVAYLLGLTYVLTNMGKHFWRGPRPFWLDETLNVAETGGYGAPSGHTSSATVMYLYLAYWAKRRWAWGLALGGIFLMGLSRIYLGQHFLHDVFTGFLLGLAVFVGYLVWMRYAYSRFQNQILGRRFWTAVAVPVVLGGLYFLGLLLLGIADDSVAWAEAVALAELASMEDMIASLGVLLGLGMGFVLEGSRVRFTVDGEWWMRLLRYALGLAGALATLYGLRWLFGLVAPEGTTIFLVLALRFVRYGATAFVSAFYLPMLFVRLGLADDMPPPTIEVAPPRPSPLNGTGSKK